MYSFVFFKGKTYENFDCMYCLVQRTCKKIVNSMEKLNFANLQSDIYSVLYYIRNIDIYIIESRIVGHHSVEIVR